jgi:hypothetical protein
LSGISREDLDPNSKEEDKQEESQGRPWIQTQKKKIIKWNLKGGLESKLKRKKISEWNPKGGPGSKLKRRRQARGISREA